MGNNSTKIEARGPDSPASGRPPGSAGGTSGPTSPTGIGSSSAETPERRETKQEREARKLEKERVARIKERARSIREEHVDGGFLVTMGVYTGAEDFNKSIVRQMMIERRIAPFWRGLDDFKEEWAEHQLVAAGRGLPIPAADEIPAELTKTMSPESPHASNSNLHGLTVPISGRSQSAASDASTALSSSHPASPTAQVASSPPQSSSPFRPRSKTLASLTTSSKTPSPADMTPREVQLPKDPFVNGQQVEVFLYKDATECPICFLYYPPYLNKTRCCDQAICSECFVQIKRPDPHPPEQEHNDPLNPAPAAAPLASAAQPESLVSEEPTCPYCQQPQFGVTYSPPPFRRGLSYANTTPGLSNLSSSSLTSTGSSTFNTHKRRTTSISADAPSVILTDSIRPDWRTKLESARSHLQRRSAAATALHTAAYLIGNGSNESRSFGFTSRRTFGRHRGGDSPAASGSATPSQANRENAGQEVSDQNPQGDGSRRRSRMDDLEDMMMMEAIRLSLAAEDDRKRKTEKEAAKEAKKKAKEEKKKEKKERKIYGSGSNSASGSALSLSLPGLGRRRGNSGSSSLAKEVTPENAGPLDVKGKGVDRGFSSAATSTPIDVSHGGESSSGRGFPGARHLDTNTLASIGDLHQSAPSPTAPDKPSHLRQMSNASSPASSFMDSAPGSIRNDHHAHGSSSTLESPNASGTNVAGYSGATPDSGDDAGGAGAEPMFNFPSLAAMISSEDSKASANHVEHVEGGASSNEKAEEKSEEKSTTGLESSIATLRVDNSAQRENENSRRTTLLDSQIATPAQTSTPQLTITPETPSLDHGDADSKQLGSGSGWREEEVPAREITQ